jgi:nascent polypeptide-associated complex subunit alpha
MMPGGRGMNPRQMQMMMKRLGMSTEPIDGVIEVIVRTATEEHVFQSPEVTILTVQGVRTYQVVGEPKIRPRSAATGAGASEGPGEAPPAPPAGPPEEDIRLVMEQSNADRATAVRALQECGGEPAEAILHLLSRRGDGGR